MNETKRQNAFELICKPASNKIVQCRNMGCTTCIPWASDYKFIFALIQIAMGKHPEDHDWIDPWNTTLSAIDEIMRPLVDKDLRHQGRYCLLGGCSYTKYLRSSRYSTPLTQSCSADMVLALYDVFLDASPNKILSDTEIEDEAYWFRSDIPWPLYCIEMALVYMRWVVGDCMTLVDIYDFPDTGDLLPDVDDWEIYQQMKKDFPRIPPGRDFHRISPGIYKMLQSSNIAENNPYIATDLLSNGWYAAKFILEKELEINSAWFNCSSRLRPAISNFMINRMIAIE